MTTSHDFKSTGSNVTDGVLCPNVNGNSSPTITLTFSVSGLPESMSYNNVGLDIHAFNSGGAYQQNADNKSRQFNVAISQGRSTDALSSFVTLSDIDIAAGVGTSGNVHKVWNATSTETANTQDAFTLSLTITKGTNNSGCFFGLSEITLSTGEAPEIPETPTTPTGIDPTAFYYIKWSQNEGLYMTEEADGSLVVAGQDVAQRQFWQFVPTENEDCYYVKNAATGRYIQSCNLANSNTSLVPTGTEPVEYYVPLCETTGASVKGCYRFTSTDCPNFNDSASSPHGLNKDGASTNVIVWMAGETNTGSWWKLAQTENLFDLRPFNFSEEVGKPKYIYAITSATTGKVLQMSADGSLSWNTRDESDSQAWYFVGTSNNNGGFIVANVATGQTLNAGAETQTHWYVLEGSVSEAGYRLRPFATKDDAASTLTIEGEQLLQFKDMRSKFSRSAQIYAMPCGSTGSVYVAKASINGGLTPMSYPLATFSGSTVTQPSASAPSSWYTLYTQDKATLLAGDSFTLDITLNKAPLTGQTAYVYFDWNRDGIFETMHELTPGRQMQLETTVPENAKAGNSRMRFRLTDNGLADAEDDAIGEIIDFVIKVETETPATYAYSVSVNAPLRGTATITASTDGTELTAEAKAIGNASFLCWRENKNVVSAQPVYTFNLDHNTHLTAFFTPNTDEESTGIDHTDLVEENIVVDVTEDHGTLTVQSASPVRLVLVYTANGALMARSETNQVSCPALTPGTYIVKVFTKGKNASCKILL